MLKHNLRMRPIVADSHFMHFTDYCRLLRPRIVALVMLAMAVSARITADSPFSWAELIPALCGAGLVIAGAIALNQCLECRGDALMPRTAGRPLPTGCLTRRQVTVFGLCSSAAGLALLTLAAHPITALLAAIGWMLYVLIYTPLKTRSQWQTPVGAAAGAMPVLLGAAAVERAFSPWAMVLFGIVYFWQFPHSMAIAWRYRNEFAAAGVRVAAVTDTTGRAAAVWTILGAVALLPISLTPAAIGLAGVSYSAAAILLGLLYFAISLRFACHRDDSTARQLLLVSLVYLPAMLAALLLA
jgi:heme o synthase